MFRRRYCPEIVCAIAMIRWATSYMAEESLTNCWIWSRSGGGKELICASVRLSTCISISYAHSTSVMLTRASCSFSGPTYPLSRIKCGLWRLRNSLWYRLGLWRWWRTVVWRGLHRRRHVSSWRRVLIHSGRRRHRRRRVVDGCMRDT